MASTLNYLVFLGGILILCWRLSQKPKSERQPFSLMTQDESAQKKIWRELAIVIPARNEAANLPRLLSSLKQAHELGARILVVDDQSSDNTGEIAASFGVEVHRTAERPPGWSGKNWACHQGFLYLKSAAFRGKYLLFTDADTEHSIENLPTAISWFESQKVSLLTCRPFHRNPLFWEQCLGPFHLLISMITDAYQAFPSVSRFFSIGQYLLFDRNFYEQFNGHIAVKSELAEDLALGRICFQLKAKFAVYPKTNLYSTRMYATLNEFYQGWKRNFRLGMDHSSPLTWLETIIVVAACFGGWSLIRYLILTVLFLFFQGRQGKFNFWGALFFPISIMFFIVISLSAKLNSIFKKPIQWKSRNYSVGASK